MLAQTSLLSALVTSAVALSILLRGRRNRLQSHFAYLNINLSLCLLATFLLGLSDGMAKIGIHTLMLTSLGLPVTGLRFFALFLPDLEKAISRTLNICYPLTVIFGGIAVTPLYKHALTTLAQSIYILGIFAFALLLLFLRYRSSDMRGERYRLRPVALGGFGVLTLILLDMVSYHLDWPYLFLGNLILAIYMYYVLHIVLTGGLMELSELLGKGAVLGVLSFLIAGIYWLLTFWADTKNLGAFFFSVLVASIVILVLYDPLRSEIESRATEYFFRQKRDFRLILEQLRRDLVNVIDLERTSKMIVDTLEQTHRVTSASFYLLRSDAAGLKRIYFFGQEPIESVEKGRHSSFIKRLEEELGPLIRQDIEFHFTLMALARKENSTLPEGERLLEILQTMDLLKTDICLPCIGSDSELLGFLNLKHEKAEGAISNEELSFVMMVAAQAAITIENSRLFEEIKERERLAALGEMSAGLAHEIRNPLGSIKMAAQLLSPEHLDSNEKELLGIIIEEVDRLNGVVSQFLDYARPLRGRFEPTDLHQILRRTAQLLDTSIPDKNIKIELSLDDAVPIVLADAEKLKQVFLNLIRNSIEAMPEGGKIRISTRHLLEPEAPCVELTFDDEGEGIPPEAMKNLFIPFYTTKTKGTGLGLSISHRIIEHHEGTIHAQNLPDKGTRFTIRLPIRAKASQHSTLPLSSPSPRPS